MRGSAIAPRQADANNTTAGREVIDLSSHLEGSAGIYRGCVNGDGVGSRQKIIFNGFPSGLTRPSFGDAHLVDHLGFASQGLGHAFWGDNGDPQSSSKGPLTQTGCLRPGQKGCGRHHLMKHAVIPIDPSKIGPGEAWPGPGVSSVEHDASVMQLHSTPPIL